MSAVVIVEPCTCQGCTEFRAILAFGANAQIKEGMSAGQLIHNLAVHLGSVVGQIANPGEVGGIVDDLAGLILHHALDSEAMVAAHEGGAAVKH